MCVFVCMRVYCVIAIYIYIYIYIRTNFEYVHVRMHTHIHIHIPDISTHIKRRETHVHTTHLFFSGPELALFNIAAGPIYEFIYARTNLRMHMCVSIHTYTQLTCSFLAQSSRFLT
jgi:hypothetical protein